MSTLTKVLIGLAALVVVVGGAAWWLGFFEEAAEEVSIEAAQEAAESLEADDTGAAAADGESSDGDEPADGSADETATSDGGAITDLTGTWTAAPGSFVGYRIDEVLNTVGDFTVVGRTEDVTGTVTAEGTTVTAVELVADMTTLTTDNGGRDRAMRSQALETDQFPEATFVLTSPIEVGALPGEGDTVDVVAPGDLTIHGVTQSVEFPLTATVQGSSFVVVGQLEVLLADYDIAAPSAPVVASVDDNAVLELSMIFQQS